MIETKELKAELDSKLLRWITEAEIEHAAKVPDWDRYDEYFANEQAPAGFSQDHVSKLQQANDPTTVVSASTAKQYIVVNKVKQTHEQVLGDFISGKKTVTAVGRTPKDRKLGRICKKQFESVADRTHLWDRVMVPSIDLMIRRGIHFIKVSHNPYRDLPNGRIDVEQLSCREVLLDPNSRDLFYEDKQYIIHRKRYNLKDAKLKFKDMLEEGVEFTADSDTDLAYRAGQPATEEDFCTIYEIQYRQTEWRFFMQKDINGDDFEEIQEDEFNQALKAGLEKYVFRQEEDVWYVAFYNKGLQTFYHEENEFGECTIVEVINIRDESLPYPISDMEYYINLQDLLNILNSVVVENAKQGNSPIVGVDPNTFNTFKDYIEKTLKQRGPRVIPAAQLNVVYPQQMNPIVLNLIDRVNEYIMDMQSKHPASMGELPTKQIAENTVDALIAQDRQAHGRKDVTIRYAMTKVANLIAKITFLKFTEEHWAQLTDTKKGDVEYTPVNVIASKQDYDQLLLDMMGVDSTKPRTQEENIVLAQQLEEYRKKFESENEVKEHQYPVMMIGEEQYTMAQVEEMVKVAGITQEEFNELYEPQPAIEVLYAINEVGADPQVDLIFDIDFDFERDRQVKQQQAIFAGGKGWITPLRTLQALDFPDAEEAVAEADQRNEILQLGQTVASNQQLMEVVRTAFAEMQAGKTETAGQPA